MSAPLPVMLARFDMYRETGPVEGMICDPSGNHADVPVGQAPALADALAALDPSPSTAALIGALREAAALANGQAQP
ncbi:MAG: hypothetical protein FWJ72_12305, partial [Acidimicrobiia bacterium]